MKNQIKIKEHFEHLAKARKSSLVSEIGRVKIYLSPARPH